jgi:two-component system sensor histidine kinase BaeS
MNRRRRGSLALRISLLTVAVSLVTAVIGGAIAISLVRQSDNAAARHTLSRIADDAAAAASSTPVRVRNGLRALNIVTATINKQGRVASTDQLASDVLRPAEVADVLAGRSVSVHRRVDGQQVLAEARPTSTGGLLVLQRQADALAVSDRVIDRLLIALAIAVGVSGLAGLFVAARLSRPLRRTARAAQALAAGQRDVTLTPTGPTEVAEVAGALNALTDSLTRSEIRQREFLLSISHDLRTPLTALAGFAESLADGVTPPSEAARTGAVMVDEARHLERLIADLLDLARLDAQNLRLDLVPIELDGFIVAAAQVWQARCAAVDVPFGLQRPGEPLWVRTDPTRLRQVMDGLLENALRVTPAGQPIVLAAASGPAGAILEVRDGGPGLTDDDLTVAFEQAVLYQRYRGLRRVGTGLGLAIVHRLVGLLGGRVEAGHAAEGGARFTVWLPSLTDQVADPNMTRT